jgi:hypothetical protein
LLNVGRLQVGSHKPHSALGPKEASGSGQACSSHPFIPLEVQSRHHQSSLAPPQFGSAGVVGMTTSWIS